MGLRFGGPVQSHSSHMLVDGSGNIYLVEIKEGTRKVGKYL
jgi:hypothetical protein